MKIPKISRYIARIFDIVNFILYHQVPLTPKELEKYREKQELQREIQNGYMYTQEDFENLHYEAETVKKLKATQVS